MWFWRSNFTSLTFSFLICDERELDSITPKTVELVIFKFVHFDKQHFF
jgi:hypothetical protein